MTKSTPGQVYCSHCGCLWPEGQAFPDERQGRAVCPVCQCEEPHEFVSRATFVVSGMCCASCQLAVERALRRLEGVRDARASYILGRGHVDYDPSKTTPERIRVAIAKSGYKCVLHR